MIEYLNIVDEKDIIIDKKTRKEIHLAGLLHREIHVYFITRDKEIIFQHRAKDKDTYPDLLDATVGGHVEIGDTYKETAVKEVEEETGLKIEQKDLIFLNKVRKRSVCDLKTGKINNVWRETYIYHFKDKLSNLKIEEGKALGFEVWPIDKLKNISETEKEKFIPYVINFTLENLSDYNF